MDGGFEQILRMISYVASPIIAIGAVLIAWQQAQINRQKLVLDRYDRRLRIYEQLKELLSKITAHGQASDREAIQFRVSVSEADFLFGPEVMEYLDEVYSHTCQLGRWRAEYRDFTQPQPPDYNHAEVVKNAHAELRWLTSQYEPARQLFKKYLDVSK
jgi:hypothetical protein